MKENNRTGNTRVGVVVKYARGDSVADVAFYSWNYMNSLKPVTVRVNTLEAISEYDFNFKTVKEPFVLLSSLFAIIDLGMNSFCEFITYFLIILLFFLLFITFFLIYF